MESEILKILNTKRGESALRSELDDYVRNVELEWVKANIVRALFHDTSRYNFEDRYYIPLSRPEILRYLRKIIHISWIRDFVIRFIEQYTQKENEWLRALEDFKREVKLARARELMDSN